MGHVFISFVREDREWAKIVQQWLEKQGFETWVQDPELRFWAKEWRPAVDDAIEMSFAVVLIISPSAAKSSFFEHEWDQANTYKKPAIPLIFGHAPELLYRYRPLGELDFTDSEAYPWRALTRALIRAAQKMPWVGSESEATVMLSKPPADKPRADKPELVNAARPLMAGGWTELSLGHFRLASLLFGKATQIGLTDGEAERWHEYAQHMADGLELANLKKYGRAIREFSLALQKLNTPSKASAWATDITLNMMPSRKTAEIWIQRAGDAGNNARILGEASLRNTGENMKINLAELTARDQLEEFHRSVSKALFEPDVTRPMPRPDELSEEAAAPEEAVSKPTLPLPVVVPKEEAELADDEDEGGTTILIPKRDREKKMRKEAADAKDVKLPAKAGIPKPLPAQDSGPATGAAGGVASAQGDRPAREEAEEIAIVEKTIASDDAPIAPAPPAPPGASAASAPNRPILPEESVAQPVRFSAFGPKEVPVEKWSTLLVYAHTGDVLAQVRADAEKFKGELGGQLREAHDSVATNLARGTELTIIPTCEGVVFNPERLTFRWYEEVHRSYFRFRADKSLKDSAANILASVYIGPVLVATLKIGLLFGEGSPTTAIQPTEIASAGMYHAEQIFISYSRKDTEIAIACRNAYRALGFDVLMDMDSLRAGQNWNEELKRLIDRSSIFQLFWSARSAQSTFVRQEWQYALQSKATDAGEGFIRPVYWEDPIVRPPTELSHLHFEYVALPRLVMAKL